MFVTQAKLFQNQAHSTRALISSTGINHATSGGFFKKILHSPLKFLTGIAFSTIIIDILTVK